MLEPASSRNSPNSKGTASSYTSHGDFKHMQNNEALLLLHMPRRRSGLHGGSWRRITTHARDFEGAREACGGADGGSGVRL